MRSYPRTLNNMNQNNRNGNFNRNNNSYNQYETVVAPIGNDLKLPFFCLWHI